MYYIKGLPENGNHGNPQTAPFNGAVALADGLLQAYLDTMGFAVLDVTDGEVRTVSLNTEAYNAYRTEHPDVPPQNVPTELDDINAVLIDHEYRLTLMELGLEAI